MKVGLLFGSFNPIHQGHIDIANYFAQHTNLEEVWLVISPQNPFKKDKDLVDPETRLELVNLALGNEPLLKSCDIELGMPTPSYTIDTLKFLTQSFSTHQFSIIMGADNLEKIENWKEYEHILSAFQILVYPRKGNDGGLYKDHPNIQIADSEFIEISATQLRDNIKRKVNNGMLPAIVWDAIIKNKYYR